MLGRGDETFQNPIPAPSPALGTVTGNRMVVADFNRDGKTDLAYVAANGTLVILLSAGDGTFRSLVTTPSNPMLATVAAADMNADGIPDLLFLSGFGDSFAVIANGKGDGTFASPTTIPVTLSPSGLRSFALQDIAVGDIDSDGRPDLIVYGHPQFSDPSVFRNVGAGRDQDAVAVGSPYRSGSGPADRAMLEVPARDLTRRAAIGQTPNTWV